MKAGKKLRAAYWLSMLFLIAFASPCVGASVNVTATDRGDGGVAVTATGSFSTCVYCDQFHQNCTSTNSGSVSIPYLCASSGAGSATCTAIIDRGSLHGAHSWTAHAFDCKGSAKDTTTLTLDNTPSVSVSGPSGTVSGPFNITGSASFKPTLNPSKGSIGVYLNGSYIGGKVCSSQSCSYSYQESTGKQYDMSHGGPYTIKMIASGGGARATAAGSFSVDKMPTVRVTGPSGTVSGPFDITGTATFKPTVDATKGSIGVYLNGSYIGGKTCASESCSYSYQESTGKQYDMSHGGPYTLKMIASGGGASATATGTFSVDKTPTVSVTGPSGTVSGPFDITGTATFKPTLDATKGSIGVYLNGSYIGGKTCSSESCSYSYKEISGSLYTMPKGGPYTIMMRASGSGATATDQKTFFVDDRNPLPAPPPEDDKLDICFNSSVNVANGSLRQYEEIFSARGGKLATEIYLTYNSADTFDGPMGKGWRHNYDSYLVMNNDGTIVHREGSVLRGYTPNGESYASAVGDYSTLTRNADDTCTITEKDGVIKKFNAAGKLGEITDLNGNTLTMVYDMGGNLATVTDPAGRITTFTHNGSKRLVSINDPAGNNYSFSYGGKGLLSITRPDGGIWRYSYDSDYYLISKTDPLGRKTTYAYNSQHQVIASADPEGKGRTIAYPLESDVVKNTTYTEKDGGVWTYTWDPWQLYLTAKTDPLGNTTSYAYDANRNVIQKNDPDGGVTLYTHDERGNLLSVTDPLNHTTSYTYNTYGQVTGVTDSLGRTTAFTYDDRGNLTEIVEPAGARQSFYYDDKGNVSRAVNALDQSTLFARDISGNLVSMTDPSGAVSRLTYNVMGNPLTFTNADGKVTGYEYDALNRLITITDTMGNKTSHIYDTLGNIYTIRDANGKVTTYQYNYLGQVLKSVDALNNSALFSYGDNCASCAGVNKLTEITDSNGNKTRYQYDTAGRLVKEIDAKGNTSAFVYDAMGRIASRTDAANRTTTYNYDANGRLVARNHPDGTSDNFTYDAAGNLLTAANNNISYTLNYDSGDRLTGITDSHNRAISYQYDPAGNRTRMIAPDGKVTVYSYDSNGRLTSLNFDGAAYNMSYDNLGRRTGLVNPNGTSATYGYDSRGNLVSLLNRTSSGAVISSYSYSYDKTGNRLSRQETARNITYSYDPVYRLLSSIGSDALLSEIFSYDAVGNRLSGPLSGTSYTYGAANELLSRGGMSYQYDETGNTVSKNDGINVWSYGYNTENHLVSALTATGNVTFRYDPFGRRIEKSDATNTTSYLYDGVNVLYEYEGDSVTRYVHNLTIDDPLGLERDGGHYAYHKDALGSVTGITNSAGGVVQTYGYDSFGNIISGNSATFVQPYTFTGREWDKETGLYYYRARYYDPMAGRFSSKDPIGFAGGDVNLYGYVQNNPVNFTDPDGNFAIVVGPAVVAVTGITAATLIWMIYHPPKPLPSPIIKESDDWRKDIDLDNWDGIKDLFPPPPPPRIDRCKQVEEECYAECSASVLGCKGSKYDQGTKFRNCIRDCKAKHGC